MSKYIDAVIDAALNHADACVQDAWEKALGAAEDGRGDVEELELLAQRVEEELDELAERLNRLRK